MKKLYGLVATLALCLGSASVYATPVTVSWGGGGIDSWDFVGDPDNFVATLDFGTLLGCAGCDMRIDQVGWDVVIETIAPSWFDEATIGISDIGGTELLTIRPGQGDFFGTSDCGGVPGPGCGAYQQALSAISPVIFSGGLLTFEFYETSFDDFPNDIDATWLGGGRLFFNAVRVPEPGTLMLLGLGLLGMGVARRRRRA